MQYEVRWQGRDVLLTCTCPGCGSIYATAAARGLPRPLRHAILKHIPEALSPGRPGWHRLDVAYLRREVAGFEHALAELFRFCLTCRGYRCPRCFEAEAPGCSVCAPTVHSMQEPVLVRLDKQAAPVEIVVEQPARGRARDEELEEQVWGHTLRRERAAAASRRGGAGVESGAGRRGSTGRIPGRGLPGRATVPLLTVGDASFLRPSAVVAVVSLQMDQPEAAEPIGSEHAGQELAHPILQDHRGPEAPARRPFILGNGRRAAPPDAGAAAGLERGPWREPAPAGSRWQPGPPEPAAAGESAPEDEPARPRPPVIERSLAGRGSAPGEPGGLTTVWRGLLAAGALVTAGAGWLVDTFVGKRTSTAGRGAGMAAQGQGGRGAPDAAETVVAAEGTAAEPPQRPRRAQCSGCRLYYPDTFRYCPRCNILLLR
jgi:hypothetical protein